MMKSYNVFSAKENTLIGFSHPIRILTMVGLVGLEPMTPTMSTWCSNQLSYNPKRGTKRSIAHGKRKCKPQIAKKCTKGRKEIRKEKKEGVPGRQKVGYEWGKTGRDNEKRGLLANVR